MSIVDPSNHSNAASNGYSRWFGTGLGGDARTTEHERRTMTLKQQQEQFGRGTTAYAERSAARAWMNNPADQRELSEALTAANPDRRSVPDVEYFQVNGQYIATDGVSIEPAQRAELDDIARNGTVQDNGRVRFGYHAELAESDLVAMPTEKPSSALASYADSGNALADAMARQTERDGFDR